MTSYSKIKAALSGTMAEQVAFTNATFGNDLMVLTEENADEYWAKVVSQAQLVVEEAAEVLQAAKDRNLKEVRDGTSDVLVTALGMPHRVGFDIEGDMVEVTKSNLSKVCPDLTDAHATQTFYLNLGVATYLSPCPTFDGFIVKVTADVTGTDGKFYPMGKFLKSVGNYMPPHFD